MCRLYLYLVLMIICSKFIGFSSLTIYYIEGCSSDLDCENHDLKKCLNGVCQQCTSISDGIWDPIWQDCRTKIGGNCFLGVWENCVSNSKCIIYNISSEVEESICACVEGYQNFGSELCEKIIKIIPPETTNVSITLKSSTNPKKTSFEGSDYLLLGWCVAGVFYLISLTMCVTSLWRKRENSREPTMSISYLNQQREEIAMIQTNEGEII